MASIIDSEVNATVVFPRSYRRMIHKMTRYRIAMNNAPRADDAQQIAFEAGRSFQSRLPKILRQTRIILVRPDFLLALAGTYCSTFGLGI